MQDRALAYPPAKPNRMLQALCEAPARPTFALWSGSGMPWRATRGPTLRFVRSKSVSFTRNRSAVRRQELSEVGQHLDQLVSAKCRASTDVCPTSADRQRE